MAEMKSSYVPGTGGAYEIQPDGEIVLVERTDEVAAAVVQPEPAPADPEENY